MTRRKYPEPERENGRYVCKRCGRSYSKPYNYNQHFKKSHPVALKEWRDEHDVPDPVGNLPESVESYQQDPHKIEKDERGNKSVIKSKSTRIKTLEQLIEAADIDLDVWEIERHTINRWEVGAKDEETGEIVTKPLWQVKAWLKRKELVKQKFPAIQPISLNVTPAKPRKPPSKRVKTAVLIADGHVGFKKDMETGDLTPFHDRRCFDVALQVCEDLQPDRIGFLGDMLDMAEYTDKFTRSPEFYWTTQASLIELSWWLGKYRQVVPDADMFYQAGNHEARLRRSIINNMKAAYMLKAADQVEGPSQLSVPSLLGLDDLDIEYIGDYPDGKVWLNDNLVCYHGDKVSSVEGKTAGKIVKNARESDICGHSHRAEMASKTVYPKKGPRSYFTFVLGTFALLGGDMPASSKENNWQNSFAVVNYQEGNGFFQVYPVLIFDGKAIWNGKVYEGETRLEDLKEDTEWEQF